MLIPYLKHRKVAMSPVGGAGVDHLGIEAGRQLAARLAIGDSIPLRRVGSEDVGEDVGERARRGARRRGEERFLDFVRSN